MEKTQTFRDLIVWQKAKDTAILLYKLTEQFPKNEVYGLSSQMRRAVISISSNIAEGYNRFHQKEKQQFLSIAFGSGSELESQIEIAKTLFPGINFSETENKLTEVMKMLNKILATRF